MMTEERHAARAARTELDLADLEPLLRALCASSNVLGMVAVAAADEDVSGGSSKHSSGSPTTSIAAPGTCGRSWPARRRVG
jgi:hypothetical protein